MRLTSAIAIATTIAGTLFAMEKAAVSKSLGEIDDVSGIDYLYSFIRTVSYKALRMILIYNEQCRKCETSDEVRRRPKYALRWHIALRCMAGKQGSRCRIQGHLKS